MITVFARRAACATLWVSATVVGADRAHAQARPQSNTALIARRDSLEQELEKIAVIDRKLMVPMRDGAQVCSTVFAKVRPLNGPDTEQREIGRQGKSLFGGEGPKHGGLGSLPPNRYEITEVQCAALNGRGTKLRPSSAPPAGRLCLPVGRPRATTWPSSAWPTSARNPVGSTW